MFTSEKLGRNGVSTAATRALPLVLDGRPLPPLRDAPAGRQDGPGAPVRLVRVPAPTVTGLPAYGPRSAGPGTEVAVVAGPLPPAEAHETGEGVRLEVVHRVATRVVTDAAPPDAPLPPEPADLAAPDGVVVHEVHTQTVPLVHSESDPDG